MAKAGPPAAPRRTGDEPKLLRCLVVEDHTLIAQLLAGMLRTLPGIGSVSTVTNVTDGVAAAENQPIDLLILDLALPDGMGLDLLRAVAGRHPHVTCIILSSAAEECICPVELAKHVPALVDKTAAYETLQHEIMAIVAERLGRPSRAAVAPDMMLGRREREVFELIGKGLSTKEIATTLGITAHTANSHRKAIVGKLGVVGAELIRLATVHNHTKLTSGASPAP